MRYYKSFILIFFILATFVLKSMAQDIEQTSPAQINQHLYNYLDYSELVELSKSEKPNDQLKAKVDFLLNNPIVDNSIYSGPNIKLQNDPKIGEYIRVANWNINRGMKTEEIKKIFTNPDSTISEFKTRRPKKIAKIKKQMELLKHSDIIILNEVDSGMPRTGYKKVIEELGKTLGYNYAYGVEFLEIDPVHLGLENYKWSEERELLNEGILKTTEINPLEYKGLHGNAILSRFPLENVRILRLPEVYDWYNSEKEKPTKMEALRRHMAKTFLNTTVKREIRVGGRLALIANVSVPTLDTPVTVISTHLENRAVAKDRTKQMKFLLEDIKGLKNPVILAGDFNTGCYNPGPIKSKSLAKNIVTTIKPLGEIVNIFRRYSDPTVKHIPIILPNEERELFDTIQKTKFSDCKSFDFRGEKELSSNKKRGALCNSNERCFKGFTPTFIFPRSLGLAKYKLDWIFVKSYLDNPIDPKGTYKLAPIYGRTLYELNYSRKKLISDHAPITLDIPLKDIKK